MRILAGVLVGIALLGALAALNLGRLVRFAMTPAVAFEAEAPPPAPDYADPRSWSALPEREDTSTPRPTSAVAGTPRRTTRG